RRELLGAVVRAPTDRGSRLAEPRSDGVCMRRPQVTAGGHGTSVLGEWARAAGGPAGDATAQDPSVPYIQAARRLSPEQPPSESRGFASPAGGTRPPLEVSARWPVRVGPAWPPPTLQGRAAGCSWRV